MLKNNTRMKAVKRMFQVQKYSGLSHKKLAMTSWCSAYLRQTLSVEFGFHEGLVGDAGAERRFSSNLYERHGRRGRYICLQLFQSERRNISVESRWFTLHELVSIAFRMLSSDPTWLSKQQIGKTVFTPQSDS